MSCTFFSYIVLASGLSASHTCLLSSALKETQQNKPFCCLPFLLRCFVIQKTSHHLMIHRSLLCLAVFATLTLQFLHLTWSHVVSHAEQVQQYGLEDVNGQWLLKFTWSHVICFSEPQDLLRVQYGWSTPSPFYELHVRIQEVSASNFDPTCIKGRRLPKNTMPKDGKNSFSCPHPCPALQPTTAYFPTPKVNITPSFCGFTRHPCTSDILPNFFYGPYIFASMFMSSSSLQTNVVKSSLVVQRLSPHFSQMLHGNMSGGIHFLLGLTVHNNGFSSARIQKRTCDEMKLSTFIRHVPVLPPFKSNVFTFTWDAVLSTAACTM